MSDRYTQTKAESSQSPQVIEDFPIEACVKAHDAEQSRTTDPDEACFDSVR
jgi:hypothetical protein